MNERVDFKLRHVVVATYQYRHEAELAAGFLEDAGIPYRLQIDDPALGMSITTPATLWVRSVDLRAAREVLELPSSEISDREPGPVRVERDVANRARSTVDDSGFAGSSIGDDEAARLEIVRLDARQRQRSRLSTRERVFGLLIGAGLSTVASVLPGSAATPALSTALWVGALAFGLVALVGRAPSPMAWLIRALSGSAP